MIYTTLIKKAISFSTQVHETDQKQKRKGKDIAYIVHPLSVGLILARAGAGEEIIVAGILHDTLEDSIAEKKITKEMLAEEFSEEIANIVESVTEKNKELPWEVRKQEALELIKSFSHGSLLIKSADILNNASELSEDYEKNGDTVFDRFNAPKEKILQHYQNSIATIMEKWSDNPLALDLSDLSIELGRIQAGKMDILNSQNNKNQLEKPLKRYRLVAQSITGDCEKTEGDVWAENEETAKDAMLKSLIEKESDGVLLDSPTQIITAEEIDLQPHTITDIIDNTRYYIEAMRENEDAETWPDLLTQYAKDFFSNVGLNKVQAMALAIFGIDRTYRTITTANPVDKYARSFVAKVLPTLWKAIKNQNTNVFYIVDNTFDNDEKFDTMVEMFELMGFAVVTPYSKQENLPYEEVDKQIKDYMTSSKMIMYAEKDDSINYLDKIKELAKESDYLCIFRNKGAKISQVELIDNKYPLK